MRLLLPLLLSLLTASPPLAAQSAGAPPAAPAQILAATAPLPPEFADGATVLGYRPGGRQLAELRRGTGSFVCLADDPADERFHVACYHRSLEPFMARGRQLRAAGHGPQADSIRNAEVLAGQLVMPDQPAALYSLTGGADAWDAATGKVTGGRKLFVIYIPFATAASTGLTDKPVANAPWLMFPGTPRAHIMFVPEMR